MVYGPNPAQCSLPQVCDHGSDAVACFFISAESKIVRLVSASATMNSRPVGWNRLNWTVYLSTATTSLVSFLALAGALGRTGATVRMPPTLPRNQEFDALPLTDSARAKV